MPQFDVQHLEDNSVAKNHLTTILRFMNDQLMKTPQPKEWSTAPQNAGQFILELQKNPQQVDEKLQNFISWCCIIMCNTKKLQHVDQSQLLKLVSAQYQCKKLNPEQFRRINALNILAASLLTTSFVMYCKSSKGSQIITVTLAGALVASYLSQKLNKEYILANIDTAEDKKNAFISWLTKVAEYIPTVKIPESQIIKSLQENSTPNLTSQYRRRLSSASLASQEQGAPTTPKNTMS